MSHVLLLAQEISSIFNRYKKIHDEIFSPKKAVKSPGLSGELKEIDFLAHEQELGLLRKEIGDIQSTLARISSADFKKMSGEGLRDALLRYTEALWDTVNKLQMICRNLRLENKGAGRYMDYSTALFGKDRLTYDDSIQQYKRWGARLNEMFANL